MKNPDNEYQLRKEQEADALALEARLREGVTGLGLPDLLVDHLIHCAAGGHEAVRKLLDTIATLRRERDEARAALDYLKGEFSAMSNLRAAAEAEAVTLRQRLEQVEAERNRLVEDRIRFPDRPDDIGRMIEARIGNLKAGKEAADGHAIKAMNDRQRIAALLAETVAVLGQAMRLLTHLDVAQYLLANTRSRSNGAKKAHHHDALCKAYVAAFRGVEVDRVRRRYEHDYNAIHDATADELTNCMDTAIGFDLDAFVDAAVMERFFGAFHNIATRTLSAKLKEAIDGHTSHDH